MKYLNDAGRVRKRSTGRTDWMMVLTRPGPPLRPGTPAGVWPCHQNVNDRHHVQVPSLHIYLQMRKSKRYKTNVPQNTGAVLEL